MKVFKEHDSVIYTDPTGHSFDTFVVYGTDKNTGLTHINHMDLLVPVNELKLHPKTLTGNHIPVRDALSFEILKKLKAKYTDNDADLPKKLMNTPSMTVYYKAS